MNITNEGLVLMGSAIGAEGQADPLREAAGPLR